MIAQRQRASAGPVVRCPAVDLLVRAPAVASGSRRIGSDRGRHLTRDPSSRPAPSRRRPGNCTVCPSDLAVDRGPSVVADVKQTTHLRLRLVTGAKDGVQLVVQDRGRQPHSCSRFIDAVVQPRRCQIADEVGAGNQAGSRQPASREASCRNPPSGDTNSSRGVYFQTSMKSACARSTTCGLRRACSFG